ncbi:hypothetical protein AC249_AIPGENE26975 [Exaiptasia diaphana]|nr:hypothetical protein AC249_AIPGENE26975 [Exaiptasia diaphana]
MDYAMVCWGQILESRQSGYRAIDSPGTFSVLSAHNKTVTASIVKQLHSEGFDELKVQRAAKKFHEHLRRVAQGKVDEDLKIRMKKSIRKSRLMQLALEAWDETRQARNAWLVWPRFGDECKK